MLFFISKNNLNDVLNNLKNYFQDGNNLINNNFLKVSLKLNNLYQKNNKSLQQNIIIIEYLNSLWYKIYKQYY